jgi:ABC-type lipoprotein export system ATPase subunit
LVLDGHDGLGYDLLQLSPDTTEARNHRKTYSTEREEVEAVRDISFGLEVGQFVAEVGRSGSGKSSLLAMLGGLCRPASGTVSLKGVDPWALSGDKRAAARNRTIGFVFQFTSLLPTLRAIDNVALPALMGSIGTRDGAFGCAAGLLARVGLIDRADAYPAELSGGEQRRVALAQAIINTPPILLADEPTSGLDEDTSSELLELLLDIHRRDGIALVVVTHDPKIARQADVSSRSEGVRSPRRGPS